MAKLAAAIFLLALGTPALAQAPLPAGTVTKTRIFKPHVKLREVADKHFWLSVAGIFGSTIFDAETTAHCINAHPTCTEANPIFGRRPSRARLYGIKLGIASGLSVAVFQYKRMDMEDDIRWRRYCEATPNDKRCATHTHAITNAPRWWQVSLIPTTVWTAAGIYNTTRRFPTCPSGTTCH